MVIKLDKKILIRFGDLMLKGNNINFFVKRVRMHVQEKLRDLEVKFKFEHDRIYVGYILEDEIEICKRLKQIPGIFSFSIVHLAKLDIDDIVSVSIGVLNSEIKRLNQTFKIETKRANKAFPMTSLEISQKIAPMILGCVDKQLIVDVKHPEQILHVELRKENTYIYLSSIKGMGGFPFGTGGKALMMMSGGIDSPVASYLSMKQGIELELFHFESTPMTPLESVQKVIDLAKVLASYTPFGKIKLHLVPFTNLHEHVLNNIFDPYIITVLRRMMYRVADLYARKNKLLAIFNGESVGQVASQTLQGMRVSGSVTNLPVIRPLVTYDKQEIINIAKNIGSFDISIRPFNDCCSIYVPKSPATKPMNIYARKYESTFEFEPLVEKAASEVLTLEIDPHFDFEIASFGFSVNEAYLNYQKQRDDNIDDRIETK